VQRVKRKIKGVNIQQTNKEIKKRTNSEATLKGTN